MPNGSLEDRLACINNTVILPYSKRHQILLETAKGINFLHTREKIFVHGAVKRLDVKL